MTIRLPLLCMALCLAFLSQAQNVKDSSIQLSASHNAGLNQITIQWKTTDANFFQISRKLANSNNWGNPLSTLPGTVSSYTDTTVEKHKLYEYRVTKIKGNAVRALGYVSASIQFPLSHYRNNILLLVDSSTFLGIDTTRWNELKSDYYMDGYGVVFKLVSEYAKPPQIKAVIQAWNAQNRGLNNQCLLIGRVPVAYSGLMDINTAGLPPDAHPDHGGAWPTDVYYAEMDGSWTDNGTMTSGITRVANQNNPGDGKFDQHVIPNAVDIQIGRIDFRLLTAQNKSDIAMVANYLRKLHAFKSGAVQVPMKAFISDNFNYLGGEMPMRSGWNNASCLVGSNNITSTGNYFDSCKKNAYIFSDVMGGGSFSTCGGVGSASQFQDSILSVFNVMFGSYFGDWYTQDNILRSSLASKGLTLTNVWAHRPHWYFHHFALGQPIGYSVINAQNNLSDFTLATAYIGYFGGTYLDQRISMNLMGDPALRIHYFKGVSNLNASLINSNTQVQLTWNASTEPNVIGYHVYRTNAYGKVYYPITSSPITALSYTDMAPYAGNNYYVVKAVKLENSNCGTYYNSSLGQMVKATGVNGNNTNITEPKLAFDFKLYPNPSSGVFNIEVQSGSSISVYNVQGQLVYSGRASADNTELNISHLSKGLYIVQCQFGTQQSTQPLIIQ